MSVNDPSGEIPVIQGEQKVLEKYWFLWFLSVSTAIRNQQTQITALEARISALEP